MCQTDGAWSMKYGDVEKGTKLNNNNNNNNNKQANKIYVIGFH